MTGLIYRADAADDDRDAFTWYEQQRRGLGEEFLLELDRAERAILGSPTAFHIIRRDTRRYLLRRFPHQLLHRLVDDIIVVVGCFHARPAVPKSRSEGEIVEVGAA